MCLELGALGSLLRGVHRRPPQPAATRSASFCTRTCVHGCRDNREANLAPSVAQGRSHRGTGILGSLFLWQEARPARRQPGTSCLPVSRSRLLASRVSRVQRSRTMGIHVPIGCAAAVCGAEGESEGSKQ